MAKKKEELKNTMAAILSGGLEPKQAAQEEPAAAEPVKPKKVRRSHVEKVLLPEPKKRTRKKKDPALKKTHTLTLLLTESLYKRFKATAEEQGYSMNGIATRLIKKYVFLHDVEMEEEDIEDYGTD